jgi:6-phosphogluconolactonase (cycloisomerase 2 family)
MNNDEKWMGMAVAMSNRVENSVSTFCRDIYGELCFLEERPTRGNGTGVAVVDPLGSQGALVLDQPCRFLFAVNAGNNTISSFRLEPECLTLAGIVPSGGARPVSIAVSGNLLYVVNAGDANTAANVSGFMVGEDGMLQPIPGATAPLSAFNPAPACIVICPGACHIIVSEKATNRLVSYAVLPGGLLGSPVITVSNGSVPFGMVFTKNDVLLVSEAGPNALSSYRHQENGTLTVISGSVLTHQAATCWVSATPDVKNAYTSNAGSSTVSHFRVDDNGSLHLIENVSTTPQRDGGPIDNAVDPNGEFLYVLNGAHGSISTFQIECEGDPELCQIERQTALPAVGAQGLAVC